MVGKEPMASIFLSKQTISDDGRVGAALASRQAAPFFKCGAAAEALEASATLSEYNNTTSIVSFE